jgi:hypothetical protein
MPDIQILSEFIRGRQLAQEEDQNNPVSEEKFKVLVRFIKYLSDL